MKMAYSLRNQPRKDYKQLADVQLSRPGRPRLPTDTLYDVEVVDSNANQVEIHYVGYGDEFDEWRDESEVIDLPPVQPTYVPFELHRELAFQIKLSLNSGVRIEMPFDMLLFEGGLKRLGKPLQKGHSHEVYTIQCYGDLKPVLGDRWYVRAINKHLNFCYVNLCTVQYHSHTRKLLEEFSEDGSSYTIGGHVLIFRFV